MNSVKLTSKRNEMMDLCKFIGSVFVVFIHVPFPGIVGGAVDCIARFAVPMFFAISGWFSYQSDCAKLVRRLRHILTLYLAGLFLGIILGAITWLYDGNALSEYLSWFSIDANRICKILFLCENPFYNSPELWYLLSIGQTYLIVSIYAAFFKETEIQYKPLYIISFVLLIIHIILGVLAVVAEMGVPASMYRNGLLFGFPMFSLGLFLHQYHKRILSVFSLTPRKMVLLIFSGLVLSLLQWRGAGIGEMPFGMLMTVPALVLLMTSHPDLPSIPHGLKKVISQLGPISMVVYIIHYPLIGVCDTFFGDFMRSALGSAADWLRPLLVVLLSVITGILWCNLQKLYRTLIPKNKNSSQKIKS